MPRWLKWFAVIILVGAAVALAIYQPWKPSDTSVQISAQTPVEDPAVNQVLSMQTNPNPDLSVDQSGLSKAVAIIATRRGVMKFKFYSDDAPVTVKRIVELINSGFYNTLKFHRVVEGFVIQGGDPSGDGTGGSGQKLKAEFNKRRHAEGAVAMARARDPDSADSQFYISYGPQPHLDGQYTVFGQVVEGLDVIRKIRQGDEMLKVVIQ